MKQTFIISLILFATVFPRHGFGQLLSRQTIKKNCGCKANPNLNEIISCDTVRFRNESKLYRQFNCDSSWLTFENKNGLRRIMYSLPKQLIELTGRSGYQFVREFHKTLLFENRQASGGGFPINFELINIDNGDVFEELGTIIYYSVDKVNNYILYLSTDSLNTVTYYNMDNLIKYNIAIPKGRLLKTVRESSQMFPEYLFEEPKKDNQTLIVTYKYLVDSSINKWGKDNIIIDLQTINSIR